MNANIKIPHLPCFQYLANRWFTIFIFAVLFTLSFSVRLYAQQPRLKFERISLDQGLSQSIVNVIHKDKKGFMWFGTQDGLNKYDGYNFKVYKYNPFDSTSIWDNNILAIHEDRSGILWIGTYNGGLNRFDRETETFTHYIYDSEDSTSLSNNLVWNIYEDKNDNLWIFTVDGDGGRALDRLNRETGQFIRYRHDPNDPNSLSHSVARVIYEDTSGGLWIGTAGGLNKYDSEKDGFSRYLHDPSDPNSLSYDVIISIYEAPSKPGVLWIGTGNPRDLTEGGGLNRFDLKTGKFTHYKHSSTNPKSISSNVITPIHEDKDSTLWIGTTFGLNRFCRETGTFTHFLPNPNDSNIRSNTIRSIDEDQRGTLWITVLSNDGLYRFDRETETFAHYEHNPNDPNSLSNNIVSAIYEDQSGVLWIGTNTGGLNKLDNFAEKFKTYTHDPNNCNSLSSNLVRSIYEDHLGALWVGAGNDGGLDEFDQERKNVTHYRHNPQKPNSLSSDNIRSICEDRSGVLWVGTVGGGLNKFDRQNKTFKHYRHNPENLNSLSNDIVMVVYEDQTGALWIGTNGGGLDKFDRAKETFTDFRNEPENPNSLSNNYVWTILEDRSGTLWIGTGGGLNKLVLPTSRDSGQALSETEKLDQEKENFEPYLHDPQNPYSMSHDIVLSICEDKAGTLWIGTFGGGLNRFDPATEKFEHFTEQNSCLPNNVVYGILEDDHGNLWLSTNKGISKFNPKLKTFKNYDVDDGLQSKEFNSHAYFKSRSGEIFFGGINGFNAFYPDSVRDNPHVPQLAITEFKIFNEAVPISDDFPLKKHISETDEITLSYWQNDISFDFVALHFNRPEENQYAYMLDNYDETWRWAGTQRTATYTSLDPGEYVFRVIGSNNDGVWNKEGTSIRVIITPPWWRTGWAYVLYALFLLIGVVVAYRVQKSRLIKIERDKAQIREAELRAQAAESQARAVQAENARKTHELEEARKLQLSMLPKKLPVVPGVEIAVYMQTAAEVGGDYYDFHLADNGSLTVVIGDATGHGLSAGTMVSVIKSLFIANAAQSDIKTFFESCTKTIKQLRLGNLYMGLALVKIDNNQLVASAAGMPPIYVYRESTQTVEEIVLKGMPLGAFDDFSYQDKRIELQKGDTILLLSDGLPELFNERKEVFDYFRVKETFEKVGDQSPQEIIDNLVKIGEDWRNGRAQNDDVTFVVLKVRGNGEIK